LFYSLVELSRSAAHIAGCLHCECRMLGRLGGPGLHVFAVDFFREFSALWLAPFSPGLNLGSSGSVAVSSISWGIGRRRIRRLAAWACSSGHRKARSLCSTISPPARSPAIRALIEGNRCGGITYKFCARVEKMSSVAD